MDAGGVLQSVAAPVPGAPVRWLRPYIVLISLLGPVAVAFALVRGKVDLPLIGSWWTEAWQAAALVALAVVTLRYPLWLSHRTRVDLTTIPFLAMVLIFPPGIVGALALLALLIGQRNALRDPIETLFNAGQGSLSVVLAAVTFRALDGADSLAPEVAGLGSVGAIAVAAIALYLVNTALVMGAVVVEFGVRPGHLWWRTVTDDAPAHVLMAMIGVIAALLLVEHPWALPALMLPAALVHRSLGQLVRVRSDTHEALAALADVMEVRDPYTAGHSRRVAAVAKALALRLGLSPEEADTIELAGRVHDIGKTGIDPTVITKTGRLDEVEWNQMRRHPVVGADVIARLAAFGDGHRLVRHHHERWDGRGYPDGLAGEAIPLGARILAVADAFDAMTSDRPYRPAKSVAAALRALEDGAGSQWDPAIVAALATELADPISEPRLRAPLPVGPAAAAGHSWQR